MKVILKRDPRTRSFGNLTDNLVTGPYKPFVATERFHLRICVFFIGYEWSLPCLYPYLSADRSVICIRTCHLLWRGHLLVSVLAIGCGEVYGRVQTSVVVVAGFRDEVHIVDDDTGEVVLS